MEFFGRIKRVFNEVTGTTPQGSTWKKQRFIIEDPNNSSHSLLFEVFGEDRPQKMGLKEGSVGTLVFTIEARVWNDRWYNDIRVSSFRHYGAEQSTAPAPQLPLPDAGDMPASGMNDDGLPY